MDPREPQPPHPHAHHRQLKNVVLVGPNPLANTTPNTMVEPTNSQSPSFNLNTNLALNMSFSTTPMLCPT